MLPRVFLPPAPGSAGKSRARAEPAFTLVELLVVLGIIGLMLTAVLPAMRGLSGSTGRRGGVRGLLAALDQARALAISENRSAYVVFLNPKPNLTGGSNQGALPADRAGRAYAIFADPDDLSQPPRQRSPWLSLPAGIAFKTNEANGNTRTLLNRPLDARVAPQFLVPAASGGAQAMFEPYLKFDPTGATDLQDSSYLRLLLFEGSVDPATGSELPTKRAVGGTGPDVQKYVWEEVRFNYATGRARYTVDPADISVAAASPAPSPTP